MLTRRATESTRGERADTYDWRVSGKSQFCDFVERAMSDNEVV